MSADLEPCCFDGSLLCRMCRRFIVLVHVGPAAVALVYNFSHSFAEFCNGMP